MNEVVPAALDGERVDRIVALVCGMSRAAATELIDAGAVRVDGVVATSGKVRLRAGQAIALEDAAPARDERAEADPSVAVTVVFADADVIVVDKQPGLVVHPGAGNRGGTLVNGLLARFPEIATAGPDPFRPGIVHRLDAGTSGLLVVARSPSAYDALVAQLAARTATREYDALVWGVPESARGVVDAPIGRSARDPTRMTVAADGRPARTAYETRQRWDGPDVARLRCRLETGRTHQIRVHLAAIGHPVVGDERYGGVRSGLDAPRPMLHAAALAFAHPVTSERLSFTAPLPADMADLIASLGPSGA